MAVASEGVSIDEMIKGIDVERCLEIVGCIKDQVTAFCLTAMKEGRIEQIDHPDLYQHPKTEFVANFLGEANLIQLEQRSELALPDGQLSEGEGRGEAGYQANLSDDGSARRRGVLRRFGATVVGRVENAVFLGNTIRAQIGSPIGILDRNGAWQGFGTGQKGKNNWTAFLDCQSGTHTKFIRRINS